MTEYGRAAGRVVRTALLGVLVAALTVLGSTAARAAGDTWAAGLSTVSQGTVAAGTAGDQHTDHGRAHVALPPAASAEHLQRRAEGPPLGGGAAARTAIVGPVLVAAGGRTPTGPPVPDTQDVSGTAHGRAPPAVVSRPPDH